MTEQAAKEDTALLRRDEQREQQTRAANPAKMQQEASVFACRRAHTREHEKEKDPRQATNEQVQTDLDKGRLRTNGQSQTNRTSRDKRQRITNEDIGLSN